MGMTAGSLFGQPQYCLSGVTTSILGCSNCKFKVGDPIAVTIAVKPTSVTCVLSMQCIANADVKVDIGGRHWASDSPSSNIVSISATNLGAAGTISAGSLIALVSFHRWM